MSIEPEELTEMMDAGCGRLPDEFNADTVPLAFPLIIEKIFGDSVPYVANFVSCRDYAADHAYRLDEICECLGYRLSVIEGYRSLVDNALPVKRPNILVHDSNTSQSTTQSQSPCQSTQDDTALTVDSAPSINVPGHLHRTDPTNIFAPSLNTASQAPTADLGSNIIPDPPGRSNALSISIAVSQLDGRNSLTESATELPQPEPVDAYTKENTSIQVPHSDTNRGANPSSAPEQAALQGLSRGDSCT
jgi:hypothetical protein